MNKKGFTLVELLATLVVLSIVMGISIIGIVSSLENARKKTEKEFLTQLSNAVDAYMTVCLGRYNISDTNCMEFSSFPNKTGTITKSGNRLVDVYEALNTISFENILKENILVENDVINPVNNVNCKNSIINFYRDDDYVYYYEINLPESCVKYSDYNFNKISTLLTSDGYDSYGRSSLSSNSSYFGRSSSSSSSSKETDKQSISGKESGTVVGRESSSKTAVGETRN